MRVSQGLVVMSVLFLPCTGYRDAQVGWLEVREDEGQPGVSIMSVLFLPCTGYRDAQVGWLEVREDEGQPWVSSNVCIISTMYRLP